MNFVGEGCLLVQVGGNLDHLSVDIHIVVRYPAMSYPSLQKKVHVDSYSFAAPHVISPLGKSGCGEQVIPSKEKSLIITIVN